jgi:TRAP transporter TAXI family solute receptor
MMRRVSVGIALWLVVTLLGVPAWAESIQDLRERINRGTVGLVSGGVNGTYIRVSADLADVLDAPDLRILSIIGKGSVQNTADLLYLRGIDIAIVQSDVLEFLERQRKYVGIKSSIHYITKLYNEEFHLLVRDEINSLSDLSGKMVNTDTSGSGTNMTATIVFELLGVPVEATHFDQSTAMEKLKSGEISALAYVTGKPAQLFKNVSAEDGVKFLPIAVTPGLLQTYLPAKLTREAYPNLVTESEPVNTLAVGAVMAAYAWSPGHPRHTKVERFVQRFFDRFDEFREPARHPKWREVSLSATVPGWTQFDSAAAWLAQGDRRQ